MQLLFYPLRLKMRHKLCFSHWFPWNLFFSNQWIQGIYFKSGFYRRKQSPDEDLMDENELRSHLHSLWKYSEAKSLKNSILWSSYLKNKLQRVAFWLQLKFQKCWHNGYLNWFSANCFLPYAFWYARSTNKSHFLQKISNQNLHCK